MPGLFSDRVQITEWLPDETFYSLAGRFHWVNGNYRPDQTCLQLFGHEKQGASHDFPARVDYFVEQTDAILGGAVEVICKRTLMPYYFPLRTSSDVANAISAVRVGGLGGVKGRLGILASRFGAAHPLKACAECMKSDVINHGVSYWHRDHQWPGVFICDRHKTVLHWGLGKVNAEGRFHWFLPGSIAMSAVLPASDSEVILPALHKLAENARAFGNLPPGFHFDPQLLRSAYQTQLRSLGLARESGLKNSRDFGLLLKSVIGPVSSVAGLESISSSATDLQTQFAALLRERHSISHPLRHVLLITAIFDGWSDFMATYVKQPGSIEAEVLYPTLPKAIPLQLKVRSPRRDALTQAVANGSSISAAAASLGVAVATAMAWCAAEGNSVRRRPKKMTEDLRLRAVRRLKMGTDKEVVATSIGVSIGTVTLLLRTEPGLQSAWHLARFGRRQRIARRIWTRTASKLNPPTAAVMRQLQPAAFTWLYRNDLAWLVNFGKSLHTLPRSNNATVNWDARDVDLSLAVSQAALSLYEKSGDLRVRLSQLCDAIPQLKGRLSNLERLPLTRSAIAIATGRKKSTGI